MPRAPYFNLKKRSRKRIRLEKTQARRKIAMVRNYLEIRIYNGVEKIMGEHRALVRYYVKKFFGPNQNPKPWGGRSYSRGVELLPVEKNAELMSIVTRLDF